MRLKFGIVSSFDVLCGNATYSKALLDGLPETVEPIQIEVPIELQKYRDEICEAQIIDAVKACDAVNIQMELMLFGATPKASLCLLKKIIKNSKSVSLTMHRVEEKPLNFLRSIYNALKESNLAQLIKKPVELSVFNVHKDLIKYACKHNATFIVHTHREKKRIESISPRARVLVHPILWSKNYSQGNTVERKVDVKKFFKDVQLPTIGLFGFVSEYKNFEQVIEVALASKAYNVVLAGGTHPTSPAYGKSATKKESSPAKITKLITKQNQDRFFIYTSPDDKLLMQLIKDVDIVVVPYLEVGQSGSGVASMAVQFGKRVVFSDTYCSRELFYFLNRRPVIFDTQSGASFLYALKLAMQDEQKSLFFHNYNFDTNIKTYLESIKFN